MPRVIYLSKKGIRGTAACNALRGFALVLLRFPGKMPIYFGNKRKGEGIKIMNIIFNCYPEGKKKALTMSYDDGNAADRRLVEIFNKYGIRGTFHLNSARFDKEGSLTTAEIPVLFANHEVSCHTYNHPFPNTMPREGLIYEICQDRKMLESAAGYPVRGMSYPYGEYNAGVISLFRSLGMEYSRTTRATGGFGLPEDFMQWHPTCHHRAELMSKLETFKNPPRRIPNLMLFYVWGHSFEFNNDNNWDLIENFCREASGLEDVWYATNIEIVDYISALRALRFGIERTTVYNPSAIPVWFTADGKAVKAEPGQTLKLS